MKEFTGTLTIKLEVTLTAKTRKEALEGLEKIYPEIVLHYGDEIPNIQDWRDDLDYIDWEVDDELEDG